MKIAIIGLGGIGTTYAYHLALKGHEVTAVARGKRLEELKRDGGIIRAKSDPEKEAKVEIAGQLDESVEYDLVLVVVLQHQVEVLFPILKASKALTIMFMFNTFYPLSKYEDVVGSQRFAFGFPAIFAQVHDGILDHKLYSLGSLVSAKPWDSVFTEAGIYSYVEPDMQSWLRSHAAFVAPIMSLAGNAKGKAEPVTWAECYQAASAVHEGLALTKKLGNSLKPSFFVALSYMPIFTMAGILWGLTRSGEFEKMKQLPTGEPKALIPSMVEMAPGGADELKNLVAITPP